MKNDSSTFSEFLRLIFRFFSAITSSAKTVMAGGQCSIFEDSFREVYTWGHLVNTLTKPYVALADGITMGGVS